MKTWKIYIASGIFIALTAIKLLFPALHYQISDAITKALQMESRQTSEAIEIGEIFAKEVFQFGGPPPEQTGIPCVPTEDRKAAAFSESSEQRMEELLNTAAEEKESEKDEKIAAFLETQNGLSADGLPASVIADIPDLGFDYTSPVEGVNSSGFGYRIHPISGELKFHYGTDLAADTGTPVRAFADGTVSASGESDSYGNYLLIDHGNGYMTMYAHCSEICVNSREVKKGDTVALVGQSGLATGPHLHFEIRRDGCFLDPEFYL